MKTLVAGIDVDKVDDMQQEMEEMQDRLRDFEASRHTWQHGQPAADCADAACPPHTIGCRPPAPPSLSAGQSSARKGTPMMGEKHMERSLQLFNNPRRTRWGTTCSTTRCSWTTSRNSSKRSR